MRVKTLIFLFSLGFLTDAVISFRPMRLVTKKAIIRPSSNITMDSDFAVRMFYQQLISSLSPSNGMDPDHKPNILFSPLSIVTVLSALAEGANGSSAEELYRVLNVDPRSVSSVRRRMAHTLNLLNKSNTHYSLSIANNMYVQQNYHLLPEFQNILSSFYRMNSEPLDFSRSTEAEERINKWVSQVTNHQIPSLIPPGSLDALTRLVLVNGVFFKGEWETMFDDSVTRRMPFYVNKDRHVQVPMMYVEAQFPYHNFERLGFEMVELPYSKGDVSMFVVLPYETQSIVTVAKRLQSRPFLLCHRLKRLQRIPNVEVTVLLPKFKLEQSVDLKEALQTLGVRDVFNPIKADLSKIAGNKELSVSDAFHKATIEVSEKGTKASAASAIVIKGRSMSTDPVFRADRPFIFFIRHNPTSSILFMGAVNDFEEEIEDLPLEEEEHIQAEIDAL